MMMTMTMMTMMMTILMTMMMTKMMTKMMMTMKFIYPIVPRFTPGGTGAPGLYPCGTGYIPPVSIHGPAPIRIPIAAKQFTPPATAAAIGMPVRWLPPRQETYKPPAGFRRGQRPSPTPRRRSGVRASRTVWTIIFFPNPLVSKYGLLFFPKAHWLVIIHY